jgi:hypothetical protein
VDNDVGRSATPARPMLARSHRIVNERCRRTTPRLNINTVVDLDDEGVGEAGADEVCVVE